MGQLYLSWDNSDLTGNSNVNLVRVSKRVKSVGGAFDTANFNPAGDMPKSTTTASVTVDNNRVYQFKVEAFCTTGGPTINDNGYQEGIVFGCLFPSFSNVTQTEATATVFLTNTDITKVRFTLKRKSDNATVITATSLRLNDKSIQLFSELVAGTEYYLMLEFYAVVNGVEVISSVPQYLVVPCGEISDPDYTLITLAASGGGDGDPITLKDIINSTSYQIDFMINGNTRILDAGATHYDVPYNNTNGDVLQVTMIEWGLIQEVYLVLKFAGSNVKPPEIITPGQVVNLPAHNTYDIIEFVQA